MSYTVKSCSSFDTNDYIDLDTALVQEELRSLGATPETNDYNNNNYRISFKNMDARETARLRDSLVTPMSSYSINVRSMSKTPVDSCAESVALFKNLANNDHIDLVSSDLKDFMDNCDMDDLMSRPGSRPNASASPLQPYRHSKDGLTSSRLSNHNRAEQKKHQETTSASTLLQKLSEPHHYYPQNEEPSAPLRHTNHDGYSNPVIHTHKPTRNSINDSANTNKYEPPMSVLEKPKSRTMQSILSKRRSIDSDGLRRLQQTNVEPTPTDSNRLLSKRHSMMSISEYEPTPTKSKLPTTTAQRRNSNLQQPAISTATLKRRNSNMQQPTTTTAPLQRRNSNLQQSALPKTNMQRRNSNTVHPPVEPEVALERRNSKTQQQAQPDRRRWSSYIPDHSVVLENQAPQKDIPQRTSRQEPRKLLNRHSMLLPSSARRYSREEEEQVYETPTISQRQSACEQDIYDSETSPQMHAQSTAEKVRRRHTLSASDKRASMGQLPRQTADKRASLHLTSSRVHAAFGDDDEEEDQMDNIPPQVPQRRLTSNDKRSHHIKTSSYERSVEEPNRYRSKLRNPIINRDYENQLSSSLRSTVLANSKHVPSPREFQHHTTRLSKRSELQLQSNHDEAARYRHESSDVVHGQAYDYEQVDEDPITPSSRYVSRGLGDQRHNQLPTTTQQRRNRALSAPSNHHQTTDKPSLMPVPVRYRKHSNNSISKYTSVPENAGLTSFSPPREARLYPEEVIQVEASRSSGGLSNSTTSSSHSSDRYYDPPTPPTSAVNTTHGNHGKRRSVPVMNASIIDEQVRKTENRYSNYLSRIKKDTMLAEHEDINPNRRLAPRRQRVLSEDNENYRQQIEQRRRSQQQAYRDEDTEDVISSAKNLLSMVKERRNRAH